MIDLKKTLEWTRNDLGMTPEWLQNNLKMKFPKHNLRSNLTCRTRNYSRTQLFLIVATQLATYNPNFILEKYLILNLSL